MRMDDDEFTREPLDARRSALHGNRHRSGNVFGALFGLLRRRIARRVLLAIAVCVLLATTLLIGTGNVGRLWRQARFAWLQHNTPTLTRSTIAPRPSGERALAGWQRQPSLSLPSNNIHWYVPAPNDARTFYGCGAARTNAKGYLEDSQLIFWSTHDAGQHWSSVPIPQTRATSCIVTVAADAPLHIGLVSQYVGPVPIQDASCSQMAAFLSTDGGAHWHAVPSLPDAPIHADHDTYCNVSLWPFAHHLYLFYYYYGTPNSHAETFGSSLLRSDDSGQTWKRLDENRPPESDGTFFPNPLNDGETLLLWVNHYDPPAPGKPARQETWLWVSRDAGDSWQPLGDVQNFGVQSVLLPAGARSVMPSPEHPLYLIGNASVPSLRYRIQIAQVSDLRHWAPLPPLPIAGASPEHLGITTVLTEAASGSLLVFGHGPDDHIPTDNEQRASIQKPAQQWLWEWNPQASRWIVMTPALSAPWRLCSDHCWNGWLSPGQGADSAGTTLWVIGYEGVDDHGDAHTAVFRIPLTNSA